MIEVTPGPVRNWNVPAVVYICAGVASALHDAAAAGLDIESMIIGALHAAAPTTAARLIRVLRSTPEPVISVVSTSLLRSCSTKIILQERRDRSAETTC